MAISFLPHVQIGPHDVTSRDKRAVLRTDLERTTVTLIVHFVAQRVFSIYLLGYTVGCTLGCYLLPHIHTISIIKPLVRVMYELHEFSPLLHVACCSLSLFLGIWTKTPAILFSLCIGMWKRCTDELEQVEI